MPGMSARSKARKGRFGGGGLAPSVRITTSPSTATNAVAFAVAATVSDDEVGGDLANLLDWSSDLDGSVGSGAAPSLTLTTVGTHYVTASVSEGGSPASGDVGSDGFTVVVS